MKDKHILCGWHTTEIIEIIMEDTIRRQTMICQSNSPALKAENPIEMTVVDFHLAGAKQKRLIILQ